MTKEKRNGFSDMNVVEQLGLLKSILESSTEYAIIAIDLQGTILAWNAGAERLYGYNVSEVIGQNIDILHDPETIKLEKAKTIFKKVQSQLAWSGELKHVRKDRSQFPLLVTITLRKNSNNVPVGYTLISRDVNELENALHLLNILKTSEELLRIQNMELEKATYEAQEANHLKSEFLANVSHELRTPLNGIIGFAQLISDGIVSPTSPQYKEFLNNIISSAHQLVTLINDVLDLAKIEAGKMEFHPEKIDFAKLFMNIQSTFQSIISEKNIQLNMEIDPGLCEVIIDAEKLKQVFYNYISNALKFSHLGGLVRVKVFPFIKNQFRLEVEDNGIGILSQDLDSLFGKFHQLDSSAAKKYRGTGLGLALTKRIVEAQGGKVGVKSTYEKGSTFYAILPCQPAHSHIIPSPSKDAQAKEEIRKKIPTILVIEHESRERTQIVDALIEEGYAVVTAENTKLALDHHQERFDAIIIDLFQPDMSNWEIIRTLRSRFPTQEAPPIVVKVMIEQPINLGFKIHDFLIKPVKSQELIAALQWVGATSRKNKTILVIDKDSNALAFANQVLTEYGFRVICTTNKISSLLALEKEQPDVVLLDPFMLGIDGFDFLRSYRQTERGLYTPLIIWTVTKLTQEERERFKNSVQRVVLKGEDLKTNILSELEQHLPPIKN